MSLAARLGLLLYLALSGADLVAAAALVQRLDLPCANLAAPSRPHHVSPDCTYQAHQVAPVTLEEAVLAAAPAAAAQHLIATAARAHPHRPPPWLA